MRCRLRRRAGLQAVDAGGEQRRLIVRVAREDPVAQRERFGACAAADRVGERPVQRSAVHVCRLRSAVAQARDDTIENAHGRRF
jgi:hypothetical protein